jgi:hypothetical protein
VLLQVTDASEKSIQLRALVSSADSSLNWDLRCRVREGLIAFIAREYPEYLPHLRAEVVERGQPLAAGKRPLRQG